MAVNFSAIAVSNEINLNRLAQHFGMNKKYKWEDSLKLYAEALQGLIHDPLGKRVYIFHFGTMVFVNCQKHDITDVLQYIKKLEKNIFIENAFEFFEDYRLEVDTAEESAMTNDCLVVRAREEFHDEIIATILAKSVALEKAESELEVLLDDVEDIVTYLKKGELSISDQRLAQISGKIFGFRFNTIAYIMLLDRPDITWINEAAGALFDEFVVLFELTDRYESIQHKTEILMDITEVFSGLSHAQRGNRLEWAIIILIAIEIVLSLIGMFFLRG